MMPAGSTAMFNNVDPQGNPTAAIINQLVNFGWEYVYHCHILSHEEMDMMRPVSVALPPVKPDGLTYSVTGSGNLRQLVLTWNDNSITETAFVVQKSTDGGTTWTDQANYFVTARSGEYPRHAQYHRLRIQHQRGNPVSRCC